MSNKAVSGGELE